MCHPALIIQQHNTTNLLDTAYSGAFPVGMPLMGFRYFISQHCKISELIHLANGA